MVTAGEQIAKGGKYKWVPFGAGRHRCIGFEFAQLQVGEVLWIVLDSGLKYALIVNIAVANTCCPDSMCDQHSLAQLQD